MAESIVSAAAAAAPVRRRRMPFDTDGGIAARAAIGVIVLATDQTLEHELRQIFTLPGVAVYQSRLWNDAAITPETLGPMKDRIPEATRLLLPGLPLDVVAYACTSGAMVIGEEAVFEAIRSERPEVRCTTPITAAMAALRSLSARRIAVLTPYGEAVNEPMRAYLEARGFDVRAFASFNEEDDRVVARISPKSILAAARDVSSAAEVDALFVACTSLRLVEAAKAIEDAIGMPVTSSNHAMAWHCLRLAGIDDPQPQLGALFEQPLTG